MENKELVTQFLEHLRKTVFVRSTNSVTFETEELNPAIEDREETVFIDGEWDKEDIIAAISIADKQGYMRATTETNDILRSAYQIASRNGVETNWEAFTTKVKELLEKQHKVMHPDSQAHDAISKLKEV